MLFLDTCTVEAGNLSQTYSVSFTVNPSTQNVDNFVGGNSGYISNGSGSINGVVSNSYWVSDCQIHFSIPFSLVKTATDYSISDFSDSNYYAHYIYLNSISASTGTMSNIVLTDSSGKGLTTPSSFWARDAYGSGFSLRGATANNLDFLYYLEFDYTFTSSHHDSTGNVSSPDLNDTFNCTLNFEVWSALWPVTAENVSDSVSDSGTQERLDSLNDTEEDTNTKITDFFGSFFDNLLHIFVPEDGYFSEWFDKVNELLSEKLGMLYAPFDLVISTLQAIYSADSTETGIPFPGIKWEDTWLVEPFTFTFASLGSSFDDFRDKVYFATDTVLVLTFLMLLQSKVKLILEGHE